MTDDERAIRDVIAKWMHASEAGDVSTVLSLMTDDALFLTAGRAPFGKEEFAQSQRAIPPHSLRATSDVREVRVSGDMAYAWSELDVTMTSGSTGAPMHRKGPALSVFRRETDGRWRLARDANLLARVNDE